jgi:broad specificity phosphatase PhoE
MSLYVVRHGTSTHNVRDPQKGELFAGCRVNTKLTDRGKLDAIAIADELIRLGAELDVIFYSYLQRSRQTAEIISQRIKEQTGRTVPTEELLDIHEVDGGYFSGKRKADILLEYPDAAGHFWETVVKEGNIRQLNFPGGENYAAVVIRLERAVAKMRQCLQKGKRPCIVSHANTIKVLLDWLGDDPTAKIETHTLTIEEDGTGARGIKEHHINIVEWLSS